MKITKEQEQAIKENKIVPIQIKLDLLNCSINPAAFKGGEDNVREHSSKGS